MAKARQIIATTLKTLLIVGGVGGAVPLAILANAQFNSDDVSFTVTDIHDMEDANAPCEVSPRHFCTIETDQGTFEAGGLLDYPYPSAKMKVGETYTSKKVTSKGLPSHALIFGIQKR